MRSHVWAGMAWAGLALALWANGCGQAEKNKDAEIRAKWREQTARAEKRLHDLKRKIRSLSNTRTKAEDQAKLDKIIKSINQAELMTAKKNRLANYLEPHLLKRMTDALDKAEAQLKPFEQP